MNNPDPEVDLWWDDDDPDDADGITEELEIELQTEDAHYTDRDVDYQSEAFSILSLSHLDYLYISLESLISLEGVNNSISKGQFPNLKVLDVDGLKDPGSCDFGLDKRRILEGFELLVVTCKEKGIMLASEGEPIETICQRDRRNEGIEDDNCRRRGIAIRLYRIVRHASLHPYYSAPSSLDSLAA